MAPRAVLRSGFFYFFLRRRRFRRLSKKAEKGVGSTQAALRKAVLYDLVVEIWLLSSVFSCPASVLRQESSEGRRTRKREKERWPRPSSRGPPTAVATLRGKPWCALADGFLSHYLA